MLDEVAQIMDNPVMRATRKRIEENIAAFEAALDRYERFEFGTDEEMQAFEDMDSIRIDGYPVMAGYISSLHSIIDRLVKEVSAEQV